MNTQCTQSELDTGNALDSVTARTYADATSSLEALFAAAGRALTRFSTGFTEANTRRGAMRDLSKLSNRELADIGIERHQIGEVVDGLMRRSARF